MNPVIVFKSLHPNNFPYAVVVAIVNGIALAYRSNGGWAHLFGGVMQGIDS